MDQPDFGGYATRYNTKCTDGRTILPGAFEHMDGETVPLVWRHLRDQPTNILGLSVLEHRDDGTYSYNFFNNTPAAQHAKEMVEHGDISALSIYANSLRESDKNVEHGNVREVSLVMAGANPGANIDFINFSHSDGEIVTSEEEAVISFEHELDLFVSEDETFEHADGKTIKEIFEDFSREQLDAIYTVVGKLSEVDSATHSDESDDDGESIEHNEGDSTMTKNVFEGSDDKAKGPSLTHEQLTNIFETAQKLGSLEEAVLQHAGTYGIDNIEYLFPDARAIENTPEFISRQMSWVTAVVGGSRHTPFSRIKSLHADITPDEARAKGYVTGAEKTEEVFELLKRTTDPQTIYKKQKLDRDDILDITSFNVVAWLKAEMRLMLKEEIGRAVLVGDGRSVGDADKIVATNIRPIWGDAVMYTDLTQLAAATTVAELIDEIVLARIAYRGSGNPTMFVGPTLLAQMLLLKDADGRRLYKTEAELASACRVGKIEEVDLMDGLTQDSGVEGEEIWDLKVIIINMKDYTIGADKGGETTFFDDFDIDYNQYKYLLETRISGALYRAKSALVIEQDSGDTVPA